MISWPSTALVFPGQGAQSVGMCAEVAMRYPEARQVFEMADEFLGFSLSKLCFEGPAEELNDTVNTQPALYVCGVAMTKVLVERLGMLKPALIAGHSLGELTALAVAGALDFLDGLSLVRERGRLMKKAGEIAPGGMAAILGLESDVVQEICREASAEIGKPVVLANDNCPGQQVISGDVAALERGMELARERGARVIRLAVSVAAHSPLMEPVAEEFRKALTNVDIKPPRIPVIGNVSAEPMATIEQIRADLGAQLVASVRWTESVRRMYESGVDTFLEVGPKELLVGLVRRIIRSAKTVALHGSSKLENFIASLKGHV